ncbi:aldehyde-activating protein [Spiribacter halobius]|uniref:Aldehyde-activating protein n=1 Tax=Sediminicurvatus halobius TaxID=2182432 RepID=A0A2U2MWZ9_9GAMM|nr:aldehyde-activating protein [Spiribacter halobius]
MLHGSCLCGGIRYRVHGPLRDVVHCHCSFCRKAHGAAFRTRARLATRDLEFVAGNNLLTWYRSSPDQHRTFCRVCGANLITRFDLQPGEISLALGTLDDDPGVRPRAHLHVASKAPWYEITDGLAQYHAGER